MYSDLLLSKQGPLAHVWLAANYDRKLSKQQLLNTSIIKSSQYITGSSSGLNDSSTSSSQPSTSTITLRLSGQLLLGIVRIYSRKTKYLLDDVNDILYKLKNSFRYVSGATGGIGNSSSVLNNTGTGNVVTPQQTIINNVAMITLSDQVTSFDLLYQEDLNLDDDLPTGGEVTQQDDSQNLSQLNRSIVDDSFNFDQSIEYPRRTSFIQDHDNGPDFDLDLDFDLGDAEQPPHDAFDTSIEVGRDAVAPATLAADISDIAGLNLTKDNEMDLDMDLGLDLDQPLETIEPLTEADETAAVVETPAEPPRPKRKLVGITEDGQLQTVKRRLVVDSVDEVETGISTQQLKSLQQEQLNGNNADEYVTLQLTEEEKLQLIQEISIPTGRRNLWNIDLQLQQRCLELQQEEGENLEDAPAAFDNTLDFDLSLPELESDHDGEDIGGGDDGAEIVEEQEEQSKTKSTIQIAEHLRETFIEDGDEMTNLGKVIEKDLNLSDKPSLGVSGRKTKREATRCFFELLVLATNDCVSLEQEQPVKDTDIGGEINIRSRDRLFNNFL
ncbi:hypothetical protein CAAN1_03S00320 [[Candida] anglica]|uniref:Rad21/Rec8-like protein N-terminal domain-containing protein n=1 Tax=[Candida] anglica TaxID=148631 RepID=A0ABP0EGH1_9ASCO